MVQELIDAGADVNCRLRKIGVTPLFVAAERGHSKVVSLLIEENATPHARNWNGVTALGVAAMASRMDIVEDLLIDGAEVNSKDNEGNSIIMNCIATEESSTPSTNPQILLQLLKAGADPNIKNKNGVFPLLSLSEKDSAAQKANTKWLRLLLENGANVNLYNLKRVDGQEIKETALSAATRKGSEDIVEVLIEFGASIDIPMNSQLSELLIPLGVSIQLKHINVTKFLLEHGANQCYSSSMKKPPLTGCIDLAVVSRNHDMIQVIGLYEDKMRKLHIEL